MNLYRFFAGQYDEAYDLCFGHSGSYGEESFKKICESAIIYACNKKIDDVRKWVDTTCADPEYVKEYMHGQGFFDLEFTCFSDENIDRRSKEYCDLIKKATERKVAIHE